MSGPGHPVTLVLPERPADAPSGGDRYNAAVARQWRRQGTPVRVRTGTGEPAEPDPGALTPVLLDGLLGCADPALVARCAATGPTVVLVHLPLPVERGEDPQVAARERQALAAADLVVVTSRWARDDLLRRYPELAEVAVAAPGVDPAPVAPGSDQEPRLLCLGSVVPRKGHRDLLEALAGLGDLPWHLVVAGPQPDPLHLAGLRDLVPDPARVTWAGPLTGDALERVWRTTDLLVHPARVETFGMVVTEAQARGLPAVVRAGTGAQEALAAGAAVAPQELAGTLRSWLTDPAMRHDWREAALSARDRLPGWDATVAALDRALDRATSLARGRGLGGDPSPAGRPGVPERPIAADWLALRREVDTAARDEGAPLLLGDLGRAWARLGARQVQVVDLGAGTGANHAYLAPRLPLPQRWIAVDHDAALLADPGHGDAQRVLAGVAELDRVVDGVRRAGPDPVLLTCAALLDLLDRTELTQVADTLARTGAAGLFALSVTGAVRWDPVDPGDGIVAAAFDAHQQRSGRPGPGAPEVLAGLLAERGLEVRSVPTPWRLAAARHAPLLSRWIDERVEAALEARPEDGEALLGWQHRRRAQVRAGRLAVLVQHTDQVCLPAGRVSAAPAL